MDSSELIDLIAFGPTAAVLAALGGDTSWNVAADWGFGSHWKVERVPVGIKFRRLVNGLVREEVLIARGRSHERAAHARLLARTQVPTHLVFVERADTPHSRLTAHRHSPKPRTER
jgi:hypothetical protein